LAVALVGIEGTAGARCKLDGGAGCAFLVLWACAGQPLQLGVALLSVCATYKTNLFDSQGRSVTCEVSGRSGLITGYYLRQTFEDCVSAARVNGYK
jgi:hypothetical protein